MKIFFKTFWAALLAFVVGQIVLVVFVVMIIAGIGASFMSSEVAEVKSNSVLKITLSENISDQPSGSPIDNFDPLSMSMTSGYSLLDVLNAIQRAGEDDNIKGIYLNIDPMVMRDMVIADEIRSEILKFKESGKFVISYADIYTQGTYYISSVADKMFVNPEGNFMWVGLASNVLFYKGLLDKMGIQPEVFRHGKFKAAVEPFIADKMSPENRLQMNTLMETIWGSMLGKIASVRNVDSATLQRYATELSVIDAQGAVKSGMIDSLLYASDVNTILSEMADTDNDKEPNFVSLATYMKMPREVQKKISKNKVSVIYADGQIVDGKGANGMVGGESLSKKLAAARRDDKVKAVVLRVNSPGGSALASEVIWHEVELLRAKKPVVISMGGMAASGGYYISAPGDAILASPLTLTGSIGVFGLMFNGEKTLKDNLGITVDVAKTNPSADVGAALLGVVNVRPISDVERRVIQSSVERTYTTFVKRVADGRNLKVNEVDSIGGGRVWSGVSALQNGLIDGYGGIKDAILLAAQRAGVESDYRVYTPSESVTKIDQILMTLSTKINGGKYPQQFSAINAEYNKLIYMLQQNGVQAIMPYTFDIQ